MAFRRGTDIAKVEYVAGTLPPSKTHVCDSPGEIPPNLADISNLVIEAHKANGDLAWLSDMITEAESDDEPKNLYTELLGILRPDIIDSILEHDSIPAEIKRDLGDLRSDLVEP